MTTTYCQKQFLLVCYTYTSKSPRAQFWHDTPLHPLQIEGHFNQYVIHVHQVVDSILQPHLIKSSEAYVEREVLSFAQVGTSHPTFSIPIV